MGMPASNSKSQTTGRLIRQLLALLISKGNTEQRASFVEEEKVGGTERKKKSRRNKEKMSHFSLSSPTPLYGLS